MRILLDEDVPRPLKKHFSDMDCVHVSDLKWQGKKNGVLLTDAERENFEAIITLDSGMSHEQNLRGRKLSLLVLQSFSNRLDDILPLLPAIRLRLSQLSPSRVYHISANTSHT